MSNNQPVRRRYNEIRKMYDDLPPAEKKKLHLTCPGKTGIRKANTTEKNDRLAAFDKLFRAIASEPALAHSKAMKQFVAGKQKKTAAEKGAKKLIKGFKKMERKDFKHTDVHSFDQFFSKVQDPLDTICDLSGAVATAHDAISESFKESYIVSAGIHDGDMKALFAFYFVEIKKVDGGDFKVKLTDNGAIKLKIKGKHAKHIVDFLEAVEKLASAVLEFVEKAPELVEQVQAFAEECADFPDKIQAEAPGMNPLKLPGAIKKTSDNVKYLGGVPAEFKEVFENIKAFLKLLKDIADETFGPDND